MAHLTFILLPKAVGSHLFLILLQGTPVIAGLWVTPPFLVYHETDVLMAYMRLVQLEWSEVGWMVSMEL